MTDLKNRAAQWLKSNGSLVIVGTGLILIAINNSFIGVFMYAVVIHILGFSYIAGLYDKDYLSMSQIKTLATQKDRAKNKSALVVFLMLCAASIVILAARDHWYLLVITIATITAISIHIIDGLRRIKEYKEATG